MADLLRLDWQTDVTDVNTHLQGCVLKFSLVQETLILSTTPTLPDNSDIIIAIVRVITVQGRREF